MRVLLLSCNTGEGHNSTAKALMTVLEERGVECRMEDVLACLSPKFSKFVCNWHTRLYKYAPKLWDTSYRVLERGGGDADETTPLYDILAIGARKLWEIVTDGDYDAIICVHVFSALMMTELRRKWGVKEPCFFVDTDYSVPPFLEQAELDGYFIPGESLIDEFVQAGYAREKLIPSGIPVRREFYTRGDRARTRAELGLPAEGIVVLLMCGSMGCGPLRQIGVDLAARMPEGSTVVAVCGKNEKLYEAMAGLQNSNLRVLGYSPNVPEYMDAADLIVTKPGGLSSTEAANKHLPMVFINAVGGCEEKNFQRFRDSGFAVGSKEASDVVEQAVELARNARARQEMTERLEAHFNVNSAQLIADTVMKAIQDDRAAHRRIQLPETGYPLEEGGCNMDFVNSQTCVNLARSFAGESQARTRYTIYAKEARKEGLEWVARIFEETAANETVHAEEFLEQLQKLGGTAENIDLTAGYPFQLGTTQENLNAAARGELEENSNAYPAFAEMARREGFGDVARLWMRIAAIEGVHHNTFRALADQMACGELMSKSEPITWRCVNCGYTYEAAQANEHCPVCGKGSGWQEGRLDQKKKLGRK